MRINPMPVYQKGKKRKSRSRKPNAEELRHWERVRALGCQAKDCNHRAPEIHHCKTGAGGRKDHMLVIGLCHEHHRGAKGIHTLSRGVWELIFGTEEQHLDRVSQMLAT